MPAPSKIKLRPTTIPNPYYSRAHPAGGSNPRKVSVIVNVRESAIVTMASRGQLDGAQVAAAKVPAPTAANMSMAAESAIRSLSAR